MQECPRYEQLLWLEVAQRHEWNLLRVSTEESVASRVVATSSEQVLGFHPDYVLSYFLIKLKFITVYIHYKLVRKLDTLSSRD